MTLIVVGADHAGFALKTSVINHLQSHGYVCHDTGTHSDDSVDYPDYAHDVCSHITAGPDASVGILICGTGIGMSMAANRHEGIRCAVAVTEEMGRLARQHNDSNVLALGARLIDTATALGIVDVFLATEFDGGRHVNRVHKIDLQNGFGCP